MQKHTGSEWTYNFQRQFTYYSTKTNASCSEFASDIKDCGWATGGIIGIITNQSFYWTSEASRHIALIEATKQREITRLETKENHSICVWAENASDLKFSAIFLSLQHLPKEIILNLLTVSNFNYPEQYKNHYYGNFDNLHRAIRLIK